MLCRHYARRLNTAIEAAAAISATTPQKATKHVLETPALIKLKTERDPEKLFHLFKANAHNRLVIENRVAFEDTISRLSGARRFDYIEELLEHQKALPQGRREGFVVRIIMLYGKAGMPEHSLRTFNDMHLFGCRRTVKSFNAVLKALCLAKKFDMCASLFPKVIEEFRINPDEFSFNLIIKALCEMGDLKTAYLVMVDMNKAGVVPDVVTYTTLISAFYKSGRGEIADGLWNLMALRRCMPNLATFNARIQYLINKRQAWQAKQMMRKMFQLNIDPDESTFNLIIKGFFKLGNLEMAKQTYDYMQRSGCKPNSKILQTMVHYLSAGKEYDLAFSLCKESMARNWFPSRGTILNLLEGLMTVSKDKNAREILMLVRRRAPPYSSGDLQAFEESVSKKAAFSAQIQYLIENDGIWDAWSLVQKMANLGVRPDEGGFDLIIEGFSKIGNIDMARKVYSEMQKDYQPTARIYQTIMHYLCGQQEFNFACTVCMDGIIKGWFPRFDSITLLLQGLMKASDIKNATEILKLVKERTDLYSLEELRTFESLMFCHGEVAEYKQAL